MSTDSPHHPSVQRVPPLKLQPPAGSRLQTVLVPPDKPAIIGRSGGCDVLLPDASETISRRHAECAYAGGRWVLRDLGSRHGTTINGIRIARDPVEIHTGDMVKFGPLTFVVHSSRAGDTASGATSVATRNDLGGSQKVLDLQQSDLRLRPQIKLDLLLEGAGHIASAADPATLAHAALQTMLAATGFARGAVVLPPRDDGQVDLIAARATIGPLASDQLELSRSMLVAAAGGRTVRLEEPAHFAAGYGQSIDALSIHSALCLPVTIDGNVVQLIYLDARGAERRADPDAPAFCAALSHLTGLALGNLMRADIRARQVEAQRDLAAARFAQKLIMPPHEGLFEFGGGCRCTYAMHSAPGRHVSGDLFDIFKLDDGTLAFLLGDVAGKGAGSAFVMAAAQAYLRAALSQTRDPGTSLSMLGRYIQDRIPSGNFITLLAGVLDHESRTMRICDAGHGYWLLAQGGGAFRPGVIGGGPPVGVDAEHSYCSESLSFAAGSRLVLYSDGVHEQRLASGEQFGEARIVAALQGTATSAEDVSAILQALTRASAGDGSRTGGSEPPTFDDDVTIASLAFEI